MAAASAAAFKWLQRQLAPTKGFSPQLSPSNGFSIRYRLQMASASAVAFKWLQPPAVAFNRLQPPTVAVKSPEHKRSPPDGIRIGCECVYVFVLWVFMYVWECVYTGPSYLLLLLVLFLLLLDGGLVIL